MKNIKKIILSVIISCLFTANIYAEEGYAGYFRGTQNLELNCGDSRSINRSIDHWEIKIRKEDVDSFVGQLDPRYGLITYEAKIYEDGKAKGKMRGSDTGAKRWTGFFNATIDGDELTMDVSGMISPGSCHFRGKINATRQQNREE